MHRPFSFRPRLLLCLALTLVSALNAFATDDIYTKFGIDLGYAGRTHRWAIFTYGGGTSSSPFTALDVSATKAYVPDGQVVGDVALAGAYSRLSLSGYGSITGDLYEQLTTSEMISDNGRFIGTRYRTSAVGTSLTGGVSSLQAASIKAAGLAATDPRTSITLVAGSLTLNSTGKYVMNLSNFTLGSGSTLTLNGTSGSAFVINISGNFNISGASRVILGSGLSPSDVLFNVIGNNAGTTCALGFEIGGGSSFSGTLLAYNSASKGVQRSFRISDSSNFDGELLVNSATVSGQAKVKKRPNGSE